MTQEQHLTFGPPARDAAAVVVMIHGRGQSPAIIREQAAGLIRPDLHCVLPEAPGAAWYPGRFLIPVHKNEPALSVSLARVEATVAGALAAGVPAERVIVLGFSQGACLAAEYAVRHPRRYGALIVWTGALVGPPGTAWPKPPELAGLPVLLTGGDADPFVPEACVREAAAHFAAIGARTDLRIYPGRDHIVSAPEVEAAAALVNGAANLRSG